MLYLDGRLKQVLPPGVYWTTTRRQIVPVDVRKQLHQVPGQEILTSDGIAVKTSASLEYAVTDPVKMMNGSTNFVALVYSHAQLSLRSAVGELSLDELLRGRETISSRLLALLTPPIAELGAELSSARVLDMMLPSDVRRAYALAVTTQKEGAAALERARGEQQHCGRLPMRRERCRIIQGCCNCEPCRRSRPRRGTQRSN